MPNFTAALEVLGTPYHVTVCFAECKKAGKARTSQEFGELEVMAVEYWPIPDVTVALVDSALCDERAEYWHNLGYYYALGYRPHFTLGKGDLRDTLTAKIMVGKLFRVGNEYCRVY